MRFYIKKIITSLMPVICSISMLSPAFAGGNSPSIRDTSVKWNDVFSRGKLLTSVPQWDDSAVKSIFAAYRDSEHNDLPKTADLKQYDIEFINGMWGPVNNPFTKSPRPVKAFAFFNDSKDFYMSPLVKNSSDGNYYVFVKSETRPLLLSEWVSNIMTTHNGSELRFSVCKGYGDKLDDACITRAYQSETSDAMGRGFNKRSNNMSDTAPSARRQLHEDWHSKVAANKLSARSGGSIYEESVSWNDEGEKPRLYNQVATWPNYKTILENFQKIRDIRYFDDEMQHGFARRISWLFPDDGCWTRATAVIKDLFGPFHNAVNKYERPSKVFAFGNLCVNTDNSQSGYVSWWYHTAPVIKDAETGQVYVLDPAVEPRKPLPINDWMSAIAAKSAPCGSGSRVDNFNICNGYGTGPYSRCTSGFQSEESDDLNQTTYQGYERSRQKSLGRNVDAVLGDSPPWLNA